MSLRGEVKALARRLGERAAPISRDEARQIDDEIFGPHRINRDRYADIASWPVEKLRAELDGEHGALGCRRVRQVVHEVFNDGGALDDAVERMECLLVVREAMARGDEQSVRHAVEQLRTSVGQAPEAAPRLTVEQVAQLEHDLVRAVEARQRVQ